MALQPHELLARSKTLAIVGASRDPEKSAGGIPPSLMAHGFRVIPVNPFVKTLYGVPAYAKLADVPEPIDLVVVFRPPQDTPEIARQAVAVHARGLWLQQGIASAEARKIATAAGLEYVENRCVAVERALHRIEMR